VLDRSDPLTRIPRAPVDKVSPSFGVASETPACDHFHDQPRRYAGAGAHAIFYRVIRGKQVSGGSGNGRPQITPMTQTTRHAAPDEAGGQKLEHRAQNPPELQPLQSGLKLLASSDRAASPTSLHHAKSEARTQRLERRAADGHANPKLPGLGTAPPDPALKYLPPLPHVGIYTNI